MTKFQKIKLICASKLKSNVIRWKIMKKTCNPTQNRARNDPINHRIKAFHSTFEKTKIWSSISKFFFIPWQNLDFKHSLDTEMSVEEE